MRFPEVEIVRLEREVQFWRDKYIDLMKSFAEKMKLTEENMPAKYKIRLANFHEGKVYYYDVGGSWTRNIDQAATFWRMESALKTAEDLTSARCSPYPVIDSDDFVR